MASPLLLLLPLAAAAPPPPALPASHTVSWKGWGAGSQLVVDSTVVSWTNPTPSHEQGTWTVTSNDGKQVSVALKIVQDGGQPRTYEYTYPEETVVQFASASKGPGPESAGGEAPEQAVGWESVTVPAGRFDALKTVSERTIIDAGSAYTKWWADSVPLPVQGLSTTEAKGGQTIATSTLTSMVRK